MARRSVKRRRFAKTKRSKNKYIKSGLEHNDKSTDVINRSLFTATFPCTLAGLRWDINVSQYTAESTAVGHIVWALYVLEDGDVYKPLSAGTYNAAPVDMVKGEQAVIAWGKGTYTSYQNDISDTSTKSMRKLQQGDQLVLSMAYGTMDPGSGTDGGGLSCSYGVQFFTLV